MPKFIILTLLLSGLCAPAAANEIRVKADAPDRYTVVKGDTLWGISGRFLEHPWQWPQIWQLNRDEIKNPHLIYPGDVILLDRTGPRLTLASGKDSSRPTVKMSPRVRAEDAAARAIPAIPPAAIEPFLTRPLVIEHDSLAQAPQIVAAEEDRFIVGAGDFAYVQGLPRDKGARWQVYREGAPLVDPDTGKVLGHEALYLGEAKVARYADVSTVQIVKSVQEIHRGDRLIPASAPTFIEYVPHEPEQPLNGRVIAAPGGVSEVGQNAVVALNRGAADGLEIGHVLSLWRAGGSAPAGAGVYATDKARDQRLQLPDERYGLVLVFRTFAHVSYALVMETTRPVHLLDRVQKP
ncbi:MAG TPA: LysM peptidoglycan-binding domain-containing protein [Burkholderiales bacterium]|nr:LysM peptidoglycan-binding domain-containing protein [Burkholderiales bacterium]